MLHGGRPEVFVESGVKQEDIDQWVELTFPEHQGDQIVVGPGFGAQLLCWIEDYLALDVACGTTKQSGDGHDVSGGSVSSNPSTDKEGWEYVKSLLDELPDIEEIRSEIGLVIHSEREDMTIYTWGDKIMKKGNVPGVHHFNAKILNGRGGGANTKKNATQDWKIVRNVLRSLQKDAGRRWLLGCLKTIETKAIAYDGLPKNKKNGFGISVYCSQGRHRSVSAALLLHWKYYPKAVLNHLTIR